MDLFSLYDKDILTESRDLMKKGDKVIVIQSIAGDNSIIGKKGVIHNVHTLATGQMKVTVRLENGLMYHLDSIEIQLLSSLNSH